MDGALMRAQVESAFAGDNFAPVMSKGTGRVRWVTEEKENTCAECRLRNGRMYDSIDAVDRLPPLHPNCNCRVEAVPTVCAGTSVGGGWYGADESLVYERFLPPGYITREEAVAAGWDGRGSLNRLVPGASLGGDIYPDLERKLPQADGRVWRQARMAVGGSNRYMDKRRFVYSNDGIVLATYDHFETFVEIVDCRGDLGGGIRDKEIKDNEIGGITPPPEELYPGQVWQPQPEQKPYDPITADDNMTYGVPDFPDYPLKVYIDLHTALDILGVLPVVGEIFDFANGIYYFVEGEILDGFLSLTAFFPVADIPAKIGRWIVNVARRYGQEAADALLWLIKQGGDYVDEAVEALAKKLNIDDVQFGKKIGKHARDYGLDPADPNARKILRDKINDIFSNPTEIREGHWRGRGPELPDGNHASGYARFYIQGNDVVITDMDGNFISILKDGINNPTISSANIIWP